MKSPDGIVNASMHDVLLDGASVCHNEEGAVPFTSRATCRESEDIIGEDSIVTPVSTVVAGNVCEPTVEAVDVGGVTPSDHPLDDPKHKHL